MAAAMKHMASSFAKLEKFEGVNFRRWQKKMHFMLFSMSVVYVLTATMQEDGGENPTVKHVRKRAKWDNDDYVCRGLILNELGNHLRIEKSLGVQDSDKPKGNNVAGPSVVNMESITTPSGTITTKAGNVGNKANASSTKGSEDGSSNPLKGQSMFNKSHQIYYVTYVYEAFFVQDDDVAWLNIVSDNTGPAFMSTSKLNYSILWHARLGYVHFKKMQDMSKDGLILTINMDTKKCKTCMLNKITKKPFQNVKRETKVLELIHSDLCDLHATPSLGNKKYVVIFIDDASRFCYVYFLHSKDEALDKFKVFKTEVELQQEYLIKRFRTDRGREYMDTMYFQSVGTMNEVSYQHSYCFNVEDDPKTFDEAMKSQDVALWKKAINDEMDSIMGNNTWVLTDLHPGCKPLGCKWIFKRKLKVDGTVEKFKARLVIQGFKQKSGIDYFDTYAPVARISTIRLLISMASIHNQIIHQMDVKTTFLNEELEEKVYMNQPLGFIMPGNKNKVDLTKEFLSLRFSMKDMRGGGEGRCYPCTHLNTCEKLMPNRGLAVSQLEYSRVTGCLMYAMTCTRPDIVFVVGKLSRYTSNPRTQHWQAIQRVLKYLKKTIDYRLVYSGYPSVLEAAGKEAEWLKNLLLEIPLWVKPMAPIFIRCDSAATLAKTYSQMYNEKSRHLGVRYSMICELITNRMVSIEFVRSQQNLADHLTKGLARDLVIKSAEGMRSKSN
uniref:Zinc finger, CCHC-type n=1 Tax=Tanacetum cinerariifolium TaxID=118510 RepID=A0A6L2KC71_TANCI|nr:zinc finger, CCHC-type [Tanacetum cinerariifolium]